jgi:4-amino-4-deoxy-L-arabinose transferase-like glycosyltransferase
VQSLLKKFEIPIVGIILCGVLIWGGFLRSYKLGEQSLWIDEGYTINAAQQTLKHGYPLLESGKVYDPHVASTYVVAASIKIFGFDPFHPWQARLPQVIASIIGIYLFFRASYLTTKNLTVSIIATICFTFFEWHTAWSRQARGYAEMQTFLIAAYMSYFSWFENKKITSFILGTVFLGIAFLFQGVAMVALPLAGVVLIIYLIKNRSTVKSFISFQLVLVLAACAVLGFKFIAPKIPALVALGYETTYLAFLLNTFAIYLLIIIIGTLLSLKNKTTPLLSFLIPSLFFFIPGFITMWFSQVIQFRYLLVISPFIFILAGVAINEIIIFVKKYNDKYLPLTCIIIIGFFLGHTLSFRPQATYTLEEGSPQPPFSETYDLIKKTTSPNDIILSPYTQMTNIYMGTPGYWLPVSLTGRKSEVASKTINGRDYYTNAPKVNSAEELTTLINEHRGYIILDTMARNRLPADMMDAIKNNSRSTMVFQKKTNNGSIQLYHFN